MKSPRIKQLEFQWTDFTNYPSKLTWLIWTEIWTEASWPEQSFNFNLIFFQSLIQRDFLINWHIVRSVGCIWIFVPRYETRTISMAAIRRAIKDNYGVEGRGSECHDSIHFTRGSGLWDVGHPCQFRFRDASISPRSSIRSFGISSINSVSRSPVDSYALENDPYPTLSSLSSRRKLTNFPDWSRGPYFAAHSCQFRTVPRYGTISFNCTLVVETGRCIVRQKVINKSMSQTKTKTITPPSCIKHFIFYRL